MIERPPHIEQTNTLVVATLYEREVTPLAMQELINELLSRMRYDNAQHFILDMASVAFVSSACLGSLVSFLQELEHVRGRIALANCKPDILFLFKVTRLESVFHICEDVEAAKLDVTGANKQTAR